MVFSFEEFVLLIEFDEGNGHKSRKELDEIQHLQVISRWINETYEVTHVHVVRVNPDGKCPMFKRTLASNKEVVWMPTTKGEDRINEILFELKTVIDAGLDATPLAEKDIHDRFQYEEEDGSSMLLTLRWF